MRGNLQRKLEMKSRNRAAQFATFYNKRRALAGRDSVEPTVERKSTASQSVALPVVAEVHVARRLVSTRMMNSSTYKVIAVASTFSPRFEQVLSEAKRIRDRFGSELSLIYVGERSDETTKRFQSMFGRLQLPGDSPVYYGQGDPAEGILRAIADNDVDL